MAPKPIEVWRLMELGADVRGHDDDGVAEVDLAAERVGEGPSSRICRSRCMTSGWAFSTSSKSTTE
jgi:hypothetical protein